MPILRRHKWHIVESQVRHHDCNDPESYGKGAQPVEQGPGLLEVQG